ncbi:MAG: DUF4097 family beta strand repeat-containing protein [Myxococcota bacterium]
MTTRGAAALALLFSALAVRGALADEDRRSDAFEQTFAVAPDVRVDVEIMTGRIELRGIDSNELRVRAKGEIRVKGSRRRVSVRASSVGWRKWAKPVEVELEIELPRKSRITARTINGGIKAENVDGELELHAANGAIEVKGAPEEAYLETMNAAIKFEGKRSEVVAKTLNGEIELEGVSGEVQANTVSGKIRVAGEQIERADLRTMAGAIELDSSLAQGARVSARSFSGPVKLRLPEGTSARFDVQSYSGGVESDFAASLDDGGGDHRFGHGAGRPHSFVVGDGDARISIESFSGGVEIERRD